MKVLLAHDAIQARVLEMGKDIARDYAGREPHLVCVLKGACTFMTDLSRAIDLNLTLLTSSQIAASEQRNIRDSWRP
jgi:hypoxanthine phosphoribosyltransferase